MWIAQLFPKLFYFRHKSTNIRNVSLSEAKSESWKSEIAAYSSFIKLKMAVWTKKEREIYLETKNERQCLFKNVSICTGMIKFQLSANFLSKNLATSRLIVWKCSGANEQANEC